ncbi:MAG TPA: hypothetical protein VNP93_07155 [Gaiellaceae bacterium]|nr:hypothetical protein [Gaiellaceae bacterium]
MLKRLAVLGVAGIFLAVPPAIAKSSSTVKAPAAKKVDQSFTRHGDGQCPFRADAAAL